MVAMILDGSVCTLLRGIYWVELEFEGSLHRKIGEGRKLMNLASPAHCR